MPTSPIRLVRNLGDLQKTASTSRVLNLLSVRMQHGNEPDYITQPFFLNLTLNESLVLKHRVRSDEQYVFKGKKHVATKIIIPFEKSDLKLGGRSFFVGQTLWIEMLQSLAREGKDFARDILLLEALDELPSLDPFILREHLRRRGFEIASSYFGISEADMTRMQGYVNAQIYRLIDMAFPDNADAKTGKIAVAILGNSSDERLDLLRPVMRLDFSTFREGLFSWKGFLYYKWALSDIVPKLAEVIRELPLLRPSGCGNADQLKYIDDSRRRIIKAIKQRNTEVAGALKVYDDAYRDLTENGKPMAFRDFLMNAPTMFLLIGERIGVISHIASFWRYRFSDPDDLMAPVEEVIDILHDFEASLSSVEETVWGKE
ncbi:MAG: hypothetical protein CGW95_08435 [Phenylobacterium zucineum]|nr:MAG: hypothetical protein CGW95_08435 [Phenylobacterium zucineum]